MGNKQQESSFKQFFTSLTRKKAIWIIIIVGIFVYFNALFNTFVWDDKIFIINNPEVHQFNLFALFGPNKFNSGAYFRPIPAVYFAFLYSIFGQQAFFYHFFQIALHIGSAIVLFLFLISLFSSHEEEAISEKVKDWNSLSGSQKIKLQRKYGGYIGKPSPILTQTTILISFFLSLVFLIHPINVESVSFIGATQSELYFLPGILAVYLARKKQLSQSRFLLINVLLLLSLLTKETGFLFIPLVLLYRFIFIESNKKLKTFLLSGAGITGIYLLIRFYIGKVGFHNIGQTDPIAALPLTIRLLNIPAIIVYYLKTLVFPAQLVIWQSWIVTNASDINFTVPLILCVILFFVLAYAGFTLFKRNKGQFKLFIFYFFWYALGMGLLFQIVPLDMTVSDRWFYFPFVGLLGIAGIGLQNITENALWKKIVVTSGIIILFLLSVRTIVRNANFYDDMTLYTHDANILDNAFIENNLAQEYVLAQNNPETLKHLQKSVALHPFLQNLGSIGNLYYILNKKVAARENLSKLLNLDVNDYTLTNYDSAVVNASALMLNYDTPQYARGYILKAIQKDPNSSYLWANLAISEYVSRNKQQALVDAEKARTLDSSEKTTNLYTLISQEKPLQQSDIFVRQ